MEENKEVNAINPWKENGYRTIDGEIISLTANSKLLEWLKGYADSNNVIGHKCCVHLRSYRLHFPRYSQSQQDHM